MPTTPVIRKFAKRALAWLEPREVLPDSLFLVLLLVETFQRGAPWITVIEIIFGCFFLVELGLHFLANSHKKDFWKSPRMWLDIVVVCSIFLKYLLFSSFILNIFSALRILRSFRVLSYLSRHNRRIFYYYELLKSLLLLFAFIMVVSEVVFELMANKNNGIQNFIDALYFTITTLTTTGYGDILVQTTSEKMLVIFIMLFGAALFLRLATSIFRPKKVFFRCRHCGLTHHEPDASNCKHCGNLINIQNTGDPS